VGGQTITVAKEYPPELRPGYKIKIQPVAGEEGVIEGMPEPEEIELEEGPELERMRLQWKQMNGIDLVLEDVKLEYDAIVTHGSALPEDKGERGALALDLFRLNAIDRQALLEALEWPDRGEIIKRMGNQTSEEAKAQAQGMIQGMGDFIQQAMGQQMAPPPQEN